jgi:hypothetical protein
MIHLANESMHMHVPRQPTTDRGREDLVAGCSFSVRRIQSFLKILD